MADEPKKPTIPTSTEPNRSAADPVPFKWPWSSDPHPDVVRVSGESIIPSRRSGISRAPAPSPRLNPNSGPAAQPKSRIDQDREYSERLRGDIKGAIDEVRERETAAPQPEASSPAVKNKSFREKLWHYADHAVLGLFELLGLLFGLPFGDDLYHDKPVSNLHLVYLAIGCLFAAGGPMFPLTREITWLPKWIAPSISNAARDARVWIGVLLLFFLYGVAPDIYQRAIKPIAVTGAIGTMPIGTASLDEAVAQATKKITRERDEAILSGARMAKERDDALKNLDAVTKQRDVALANVSRVQDVGSYPKQNEKGPIKWNDPASVQLFVVSMDTPGFVVNGALFWGESTESVSITEAYAISGMTGHKQDLKANVANKGYFPVDKVDIPPGAPVHLDLVWNPPIPLKDFLSQWGKFHVVIVYNGIKFEQDYDEVLVRRKLQDHAPSMFGPQMTPRDDK